MRRHARALAFLCCLFAGCGARGGTLSIDLVTDLVPGVEIFAARTTVAPIGVTPDPTMSDIVLLSPDGDFAMGERIAEVRALPPGDHHAVIELFDNVGGVLVTRGVDVHVAGSIAVQVVVSRDCLSVSCPGAGDPDDATECLAGHCVSPECSDGSCASSECETDGDCPVPEADCATYRCRTGVCLAYSTPGMCPMGTACSPDVGCLPIAIPVDPSMDLDGDGVVGADDCDGSDPTVYRGAPEICGDTIDQDCDHADLGCGPDGDGDGWHGDADCDDANPAVSPGAEETCGNTLDEDCDGYDLPCTIVDTDHDGWSVPADCDDTDALTNPEAVDICGDHEDQDCEGGDESPPCLSGYTQPCGVTGGCRSSPRQRLVCAHASGAPARSCLRCCVYCANDTRFHWLNVGHDCATFAAQYCSQAGRGGLLDQPGIDPARWGACTHL